MNNHFRDHTSRSIEELLSLKGKSSVVTGGASGIGEGIVRRLAEAGSSVIIADIDLKKATNTSNEIAETTGAKVIAHEVDVTDSSSLAEAAEACLENFGSLEIWVNNAGIFPTTGPAVEAEDSFVDEMLEVNVRGTFAGSREAALRMKTGGVIINLASTQGLTGGSGISAYTASKHAVVGLTKSLAIELAPMGVRVVAVAPGVIDTPGVRDQLEPLKKAGIDVSSMAKNSLLGRSGVPDDIARVVLFLASEMADWITGATIPVDAGKLAG
jgi:NAD(P)-dependent dehydrogenase (short-subunit alcohol dehydrogenase family)